CPACRSSSAAGRSTRLPATSICGGRSREICRWYSRVAISFQLSAFSKRLKADSRELKASEMRSDNRPHNQLRDTTLTPNYLPHAEGSVFIEAGRTKVICTASVEDRVPPFLRNTGKGWVTAEYGMLPRATSTRTQREASQ